MTFYGSVFCFSKKFDDILQLYQFMCCARSKKFQNVCGCHFNETKIGFSTRISLRTEHESIKLGPEFLYSNETQKITQKAFIQIDR